MKIRELKYEDCITLARLIQKLVDAIGTEKLLNVISAEKKSETGGCKTEEEYSQIGAAILQKLIQYVSDDVNIWFADLVGCTTAELLEMSFDTPFLIITQIIEAADSNDFFTTVSHLYKTIAGCGTRWKSLFQR